VTRSTLSDPRPQVTRNDVGFQVIGARCTRCSYGSVLPTRRCPVCSHPVRSAAFGPAGVIWSHTTVRIPFGTRTPPYPIAYVDLQADDGSGRARVLAHPDSEKSLAVGARVELIAPSEDGDVLVRVLTTSNEEGSP
jgi:uncharacterized protein